MFKRSVPPTDQPMPTRVKTRTFKKDFVLSNTKLVILANLKAVITGILKDKKYEKYINKIVYQNNPCTFSSTPHVIPLYTNSSSFSDYVNNAYQQCANYVVFCSVDYKLMECFKTYGCRYTDQNSLNDQFLRSYDMKHNFHHDNVKFDPKKNIFNLDADLENGSIRASSFFIDYVLYGKDRSILGVYVKNGDILINFDMIHVIFKELGEKEVTRCIKLILDRYSNFINMKIKNVDAIKQKLKDEVDVKFDDAVVENIMNFSIKPINRQDAYNYVNDYCAQIKKKCIDTCVKRLDKMTSTNFDFIVKCLKSQKQQYDNLIFDMNRNMDKTRIMKIQNLVKQNWNFHESGYWVKNVDFYVTHVWDMSEKFRKLINGYEQDIHITQIKVYAGDPFNVKIEYNSKSKLRHPNDMRGGSYCVGNLPHLDKYKKVTNIYDMDIVQYEKELMQIIQCANMHNAYTRVQVLLDNSEAVKKIENANFHGVESYMSTNVVQNEDKNVTPDVKEEAAAPEPIIIDITSNDKGSDFLTDFIIFVDEKIKNPDCVSVIHKNLCDIVNIDLCCVLFSSNHECYFVIDATGNVIFVKNTYSKCLYVFNKNDPYDHDIYLKFIELFPMFSECLVMIGNNNNCVDLSKVIAFDKVFKIPSWDTYAKQQHIDYVQAIKLQLTKKLKTYNIKDKSIKLRNINGIIEEVPATTEPAQVD